MTLKRLERAARLVANVMGVESRFVSTPVGQVHVYDAPGRGSLPTLVLLHGIGGSGTPYLPLFRRLRPHFSRVLAPEAPGHGFSEVPSTADPDRLLEAIFTVLDAELTGPAVLFGNSMGGGVALRYALAQPGRVLGLVLSSPAGAYMEPEELRLFLQRFDLHDAAAARRFLTSLYHRPRWYLRFVASDVSQLFSRPFMRQVFGALKPEHQLSPEELASLTQPGLLLWGRSEQLMPSSHLAYFRTHLPQHIVVDEPEGFGHCPHLEVPGILAQRILEFARGLERIS